MDLFKKNLLQQECWLQAQTYKPKKAGGLTRKAGWQGRWAGLLDVQAVNDNIFVAATSRTNKTKQGRLVGPLHSLPK